jgi:hypothetical protein
MMVPVACRNVSASMDREVSSTSWPSSAQSREASATAATQSGWVSTSLKLALWKAMRNRPAERPTSSR